jgi:glycosyltransferase involved in cell wall biosynthesis
MQVHPRAPPIPDHIVQPSIRLNLILPCYNPPEDWATAMASRYAQFCDIIGDLVTDVHLIVVNDGSPRNMEESRIATLKTLIPGVQVVSYLENRGKGYALRQGAAAGDADFYLVTDADFPYTLESMRQVVVVLKEKGGIVAGNRDTSYYEKVPAFRRLLSKGLRWMLRNLLRQPIGDSQCGLKGFDAAGKAVFLETTIDRFLFDLEFLMLANGQVPVTPVPVELRDGVVFSQVGYKILAREGRNFIQLLLRQPKKGSLK